LEFSDILTLTLNDLEQMFKIKLYHWQHY